MTSLAMGNIVDVRYCKVGGDVMPPDVEGYRFLEWNHGCKGILRDLEVCAVYKGNKYQVTVFAVYADGTESGHTVYEARAGEVVTLPVYESSLEKVILEGMRGSVSLCRILSGA